MQLSGGMMTLHMLRIGVLSIPRTPRTSYDGLVKVLIISLYIRILGHQLLGLFRKIRKYSFVGENVLLGMRF